MRKQSVTALLLALALLCTLVLPAGAADLSPKLTYTQSGNTATLTLGSLGQESVYGVQLEFKLAGSYSSATFTPANSAAYAPPCRCYAVDADTTLVTLYLTAQTALNQGASLSLGKLTLPSSFTMPTTATAILLGHDLTPLVEGVSIPVSKQSTSPGGGGGGGGGTGGGSGSSSDNNQTADPSTDETEPTPLPFTDVAADAWYFDAVDYAYRHGLMNGTSTTVFSPEGVTSRAMIVTILHRLAGTPAAPAPDFPDMVEGMYYIQAVGWAAQEGIVLGYDTGLFLPDGPITREQMAAILYRYAQRIDYDVTARGDLSTFTDQGDISDYAREAMIWAVGAGLFTGMGDGTIAPQGHTTRAQAATLLTRFCRQGAGMGQGYGS